MYPVQNKRYRDSPYVRNISGFTRAVEERIPTFSRALDKYFDIHFEAIIEEWQLLTDYELADLERRVEVITEKVQDLYDTKTTLEKRTANLEAEIEELEELHETD